MRRSAASRTMMINAERWYCVFVGSTVVGRGGLQHDGALIECDGLDRRVELAWLAGMDTSSSARVPHARSTCLGSGSCNRKRMDDSVAEWSAR